jgi:hypothetical protein
MQACLVARALHCACVASRRVLTNVFVCVEPNERVATLWQLNRKLCACSSTDVLYGLLDLRSMSSYMCHLDRLGCKEQGLAVGISVLCFMTAFVARVQMAYVFLLARSCMLP